VTTDVRDANDRCPFCRNPSSWLSTSSTLVPRPVHSAKVLVATYESGSWGPKEADELLERDGRKWRTP